jgi:hypothetical protein
VGSGVGDVPPNPAPLLTSLSAVARLPIPLRLVWQAAAQSHSKSTLLRCCDPAGRSAGNRSPHGEGALAGARGKRGSPALAPPLDRHDRPSPRPASAAPDAPLEVERLNVRAKPEPKKKLGRQQRDVMAGGAIDLHAIALPEILDLRQVQRQYSGLRSRNVLRMPASLVNGDWPSSMMVPLLSHPHRLFASERLAGRFIVASGSPSRAGLIFARLCQRHGPAYRNREPSRTAAP